MSVLPPQQYTYTSEESVELFIHSIKGNRACNKERKDFNLCRSTILGKFVEPDHCKDKASTFIDCFHKVRRDESQLCKSAFNRVFECANKNNTGGLFSFGANCQTELDGYLSC